ncbi:hypothetical protein PMAYCL1PPCAC_07626 [Pristionchus mayeri]|uniref:Nuclear receptor n=1 Tax=Pristionchus mayeri TaxID=1317129 RepID=A0AAN5CDE5_9BILA|nr:hypothetical protein PMAYCL1PPCAC_07626 [Pristionchus mayeri]
MSNPIICCICSAQSNYAHLGINACRSCADFYKRASSSARIISCRKGEGKCTIMHGNRHNCRGCRFEKCKLLGMQLTSRKEGEQQKDEMKEQQSRSDDELKDPLISRIFDEYLRSVARRKNTELLLRPTSLHRHVKVEINEDLLLCSWTFLMDCLKMYAGDFLQFASATFPEFARLSLDDQRLILKCFASRLFLLEGIFGTFTNFSSYEGPYFMATLTTCYDSRNFRFFTEEESPSSCGEIVKLMEYYVKPGKCFGPFMEKSQFTEVECAILFALSIWQNDFNHHLPDHIVAIAEIVRRQIFDSIKQYYHEELGLEDYSVRLGNLVTFEHMIQEGTNILNEEVQAYNLTGILTADSAFLQLVMQISL